jgi:AraC family transcriptional regulator
MKSNLHRKMTLPELSESVDLSLSHFSHLFKADTGISPGKYLIRLRLKKARKLLGRARAQVKQAMLDSGFRDKGNFARSFRDAFGALPSEYRKTYLLRKTPRRRNLDPQ